MTLTGRVNMLHKNIWISKKRIYEYPTGVKVQWVGKLSCMRLPGFNLWYSIWPTITSRSDSWASLYMFHPNINNKEYMNTKRWTSTNFNILAIEELRFFQNYNLIYSTTEHKGNKSCHCKNMNWPRRYYAK